MLRLAAILAGSVLLCSICGANEPECDKAEGSKQTCYFTPTEDVSYKINAAYTGHGSGGGKPSANLKILIDDTACGESGSKEWSDGNNTIKASCHNEKFEKGKKYEIVADATENNRCDPVSISVKFTRDK